MDNDRFKFRGRRIDNGELVYGSLLRDECGYHIATFVDECVDAECNSWELRLVLVGIVDGSQEQCTGLRDYNKKMIYEGDIVCFLSPDQTGRNRLTWRDVYFDDELCEFGLRRSNALLHAQFSHEFEVVGNIHKNKDLLNIRCKGKCGCVSCRREFQDYGYDD